MSSNVPQLTDEQQRVLEDILERFDKNQDGVITLAEIMQEFESIGDQGTASLLKELMLANWDTDKNEVLSSTEIRAMAIQWASYPGDQSKSRA